MDARPINIGFVLTSLPVGGQERGLLSIISRLDRERFRSFIYCLKDPGELGPEFESAGATVRSWFLKCKWDAGVLFRLIKCFRRDRIDIINTVGYGDCMFWGRLAGKLAGVPVIISAIHCTTDTRGHRVIGHSNRLLAPITDAFVCVGHAQARHLARHEGLPENRMWVIYNGVDVAEFEPAPGDRERIRKQIGANDDTNVIGIVAALRWEKAHWVLLEAMREVLARFPNTLLVVVGDGPEREKIERQIGELGLQPSVRLLGTRGDVPAVLAGIDIAVLCSETEAFPVSVVEYMAAGKPVVASRVGSVEEMVEDGRTGLLIPPRDPQALAGAIVHVLEEPGLAHKMGLAGREKAMSDFNIYEMERRRARLFEELLQKKGGLH